MAHRHTRLIPILTFISIVLTLLAIVPSAFPQAPQTPRQIPDWVAYRFLFHRVVLLNNRADRAAAAGQDRSSFRHLVRNSAGLTQPEGDLLERAALECEDLISKQDEKVQVVLAEIRGRHPYGLYNPSFPPKPDPRLIEMQKERENIVIAARDRLREALGEESFARLDAYVRRDMARNATHSTSSQAH
ncbi:MAG: hypothetical protein ACRD3E_06665 [Terriglobales bacterium]